MAFPLPPSFRAKMATTNNPNPMGVSESESDDAPVMKGEKMNPLKMWAQSKLSGQRTA